MTYRLTNDGAMRIDYAASSDKDSVIDFTNHSYFNLAGNGSGSVADQMLRSAFAQMVHAHGYDRNFVLNQGAARGPGDGVTFAARAYDPGTGRVIDCFTTEPGVQVCTSNGMNGSVVGSAGRLIARPRGSRSRRSISPTALASPIFQPRN